VRRVGGSEEVLRGGEGGVEEVETGGEAGDTIVYFIPAALFDVFLYDHNSAGESGEEAMRRGEREEE
jgi:hypothetical protein